MEAKWVCQASGFCNRDLDFWDRAKVIFKATAAGGQKVYLRQVLFKQSHMKERDRVKTLYSKYSACVHREIAVKIPDEITNEIVLD